MRKFGYPLGVVFVALLSVVLSEIGVFLLLSNAPYDVTGHLFATLVIVQLVVVGLATLLLQRIYKYRVTVFIPLYVIAVNLLYGFALGSTGNPFSDILSYLLAVNIACLIVCGGFYWKFARDA